LPPRHLAGDDLLGEAGASLRLNQMQVIGSHNSFKTAVDPNLLGLMVDVMPKAKNLDYAHPPLRDQLNLGLRGLELDLFHDPEGGLYAKPMGQSMVEVAGKQPRPYDPQGKMRQPGFKVMHVQDIDFRSNCPLFVDALREIRAWSNNHPRHLPIIITMNLSDADIPLPGSVKPAKFDAAALDQLDAVLLAELGKEKLILPDMVRGDHQTLEAAVLQTGWPKLSAVRGRVMFVMDETGPKRQAYIAGHAGLRGRVLFVKSSPGMPEAAVMIRNDPIGEHQAIRQLVRQGYLVRTRADAETQEARRGDTTRFEHAQKCGAQVISTDYYQADWRLNPTYRVRFDRGACARLNPVTAPGP